MQNIAKEDEILEGSHHSNIATRFIKNPVAQILCNLHGCVAVFPILTRQKHLELIFENSEDLSGFIESCRLFSYPSLFMSRNWL